MNDEKLKTLRSSGIMLQRSKEHFSARIGLTGGAINAKQLRQLADLCEKHGTGSVHVTTRQAIEIHHIPSETVDDFVADLSASELTTSRSGKRVRTVVACPGSEVCRCAQIDSQEIAREIEQRFALLDNLPGKVKFAIAGCHNSCTRARFNDIGVLGAPRGGFRLYVGGKGGRQPQIGHDLGVFETPEKLMDRISDLLEQYAAEADPKQRIGATNRWKRDE